MACLACGCLAPTRYVEFHQNIGALIVRFPKEIKGYLCKRCINQYFWKFTLTTAAIGWFGFVSLIVTPIFIVKNIIQFCGTLGMKISEPSAPAYFHPTLSMTPEIALKIDPFRSELETRLSSTEIMDVVTMNVAQRAGCSAIQVELYIEQKMKKK